MLARAADSARDDVGKAAIVSRACDGARLRRDLGIGRCGLGDEFQRDPERRGGRCRPVKADDPEGHNRGLLWNLRETNSQDQGRRLVICVGRIGLEWSREPGLFRGTGVIKSGARGKPRGVDGVSGIIEKEHPHPGSVEKDLEPVALGSDKDPSQLGVGKFCLLRGADQPCPVETEQAYQNPSPSQRFSVSDA